MPATKGLFFQLRKKLRIRGRFARACRAMNERIGVLLTPIKRRRIYRGLKQLGSLGLKDLQTSGTRFFFPSKVTPSIAIIVTLSSNSELAWLCVNQCCKVSSQDVEWSFVVTPTINVELLTVIKGADIITAISQSEEEALNEAARKASSKFLLFVGNGIFLLTKDFNRIIEDLSKNENACACGGKLLFASGEVAEAGGLILDQGAKVRYGHGKAADFARVMFSRETDFCSHKMMMVEREAFLEVNGFDGTKDGASSVGFLFSEKLRIAGKSMIYEPWLVGVCLETESGDGVYPQAKASDVLRRRNRLTSKCRILMIDDAVPFPWRGAGLPRTRAIISALLDLGCFVTFLPLQTTNESWTQIYEVFDHRLEVLLDHGHDRLGEVLESGLGSYEMYLISRPHNMEACLPFLERMKRGERPYIAYDAEAIFCLRDFALARLQGNAISEVKENECIRREIAMTSQSDSVISVSANEARLFKDFGARNVQVISHSVPTRLAPASIENRTGLLFVGGLNSINSPNADSILWYTQEVHHLLEALAKEPIILTLVGENNAGLDFSNQPSVNLLGRVDDLLPLYDSKRVFIAPTRYSGGIPLKIIEAAAAGIPIVATSQLAEQLGWQNNQELLVADSADEFAKCCFLLLNDELLWNRIRDRALFKIRSEYSQEAFVNAVDNLVRSSHHFVA